MAVAVLTLGIAPAAAQQIDMPQSVFGPPGEEFKPYGLQLGSITILPTATVRLEYDNNIFASKNNRVDDRKFIFTPRMDFNLERGSLKINSVGEARLRRYFDNPSQNSTGALVGSRIQFIPDEANKFTGTMSWERVVEDRGDPEARTDTRIGPRINNFYAGELSYEHSGTRIGFDVHGGVSRLDYISVFDAERDHDIYSGNARISYRVSGPINIFARGYVLHRKFRLQTDSSGINRDATTFGTRGGISFDPGGKLSGDIGLGLFRFDPKDVTLKGRTGFSAQASMKYQATPRLGFSLDAFRGDVATVRRGAQSRTDTRLQLAIQQELRHNLRWQAGALYRRTDFVGSGIRETTKGGFGEIEYLSSRHLAIAATARFSDRSSNDPLGNFDRFRVGVELRLKY